MHQITCESSPRLEWGGPPRCIKLPVNRHQDWNEVALSTKYVIGPVQHVIGPVQHVIGPP
ncbi:hypothetical protein TNCV_2915611, partial [Trichonephila clavipes]